MTRNVMRWFAVWTVLFTLAATGCESVVTTEPFGERVTDVDRLEERMAGAWQIGDEIVHIRIEADGTAHAAMVRATEDGFELEEVRSVIHELDDRWYVFTPTDSVDDDGSPQYDFARLSFAGRETMLLMLPNASTFREAVEAEEVVGEVRGRTFEQARVDDHESMAETGADAGEEADGSDEGHSDGRESKGLQRKTILTDRESVEAFISADDVGRQFAVDLPLVLHRLTGPPDPDEE